MNLSLLSGIVIALMTLWFGVFKSVGNPSFYLDFHALVVVGGGTLATALIAFPAGQLFGLGSAIITWMRRRRTPDYKVVQELYAASLHIERYRDLTLKIDFSHPFLNEGLPFVVSEDFDESQIQRILVKRIAYFRKRLLDDAKVLAALSKFPPAFGLLGASTGMISMLINLSSGGTDKIGSSMAVALVATFWGIGLANLVLLPLGDFASKISQEDVHTRMIILEGLLMIKRKEPPHVMIELLKSYLAPSERLKVKLAEPKGPGEPEIQRGAS